MYSNADLDLAVKNKILKAEDVATFRAFIASDTADEENFKLVTSFNDIFVTIASMLFLFSIAWISWVIKPNLSGLSVAVSSWCLAEFFTRNKRMALPSIFLALTFTLGIFATIYPKINPQIVAEDLPFTIPIAFAVSTIAAWVHWQRFHTPVIIATGIAAAAATCFTALICIIPQILYWTTSIIFCIGLLIFILAMQWDMKDLKRVKNESDVAFWLHLLAAPLITYPISIYLIDFNERISTSQSLLVIVLYITISIVSLVIDRRSLMLSALFYMLYVLNNLLKQFGIIELNIALAACFIGFSLLLLSAFWMNARSFFTRFLPNSLQQKLPS